MCLSVCICKSVHLKGVCDTYITPNYKGAFTQGVVRNSTCHLIHSGTNHRPINYSYMSTDNISLRSSIADRFSVCVRVCVCARVCVRAHVYMCSGVCACVHILLKLGPTHLKLTEHKLRYSSSLSNFGIYIVLAGFNIFE